MLPTFVLTSNPHRFDGITDPNVHFVGGQIGAVATAVHHKIASITGDQNSLVFVFGGATVVKQMLEENLLDVVRLFVTPDVLGSGVPLFDVTGTHGAQVAGGSPTDDPIQATLNNFTQVNERKFSSGLIEKIFARN
jgi:dihydrofolate reductase